MLPYIVSVKHTPSKLDSKFEYENYEDAVKFANTMVFDEKYFDVKIIESETGRVLWKDC